VNAPETVTVVLTVLALVVLVWGVSTYNRFVRLNNLVQEAWRQIDVELRRRHDLIPNLVESVKGYAVHESGVLQAVTVARTAASQPVSGPAEQAGREETLSAALGRLFALAEAYPALRASENFAHLQAELTNTEDRIAAGRRFYNANVRGLNTRIRTFPSSVLAGLLHVTGAEYFEVTDPAVRAAPRADFGGGPAEEQG
jgi:LemA protein